MTPKDTGFLQLRRGFWEHIRDGRMNHSAGLSFAYICSQANSRTGVWTGSAGALAGELAMPVRTAAHILERLEEAGYIRRFAIAGRHSCYPILVHKYGITSGEHKGEQLDAVNSVSPTSLAYTICQSWEHEGEQQGEQQGEQVAGQGEVYKRDSIPNTLESAYADTQLSASEVAAREPQVAACAAPTQRATRFPEDFHLSEKLRDYATAHGMPAEALAGQFEHFSNHHQAKGSKFVSWERAWYTWVLNSKTFQRGAGYGESADERRRREASEQVARVVRSVQAERARRAGERMARTPRHPDPT